MANCELLDWQLVQLNWTEKNSKSHVLLIQIVQLILKINCDNKDFITPEYHYYVLWAGIKTMDNIYK